MRRDELEPLISEAELRSVVTRLAREIDRDYADTGLVLVCVLRGAVIFVSDLMRALQVDVHRLEFLRASSYGSGTQSSGNVHITTTFRAEHIAGRHVLIVDDIADSGHTCVAITDYLSGMAPASLRFCVLLDKPERRQVEAACDYVGFTIPDYFVVGYGMDFDGKDRGRPEIYYFPDR